MDVLFALIFVVALLAGGIVFAIWQIRAHISDRGAPAQQPVSRPDLEDLWFNGRR